MSNFRQGGSDTFNPQYGDVQWKRRLNNWLEEAGVEIEPVYYFEDGGDMMQVTQENTIIFINEIADELDCVALQYPPGSGETVFYFRDVFRDDDHFMETVELVGGWAMTMYTMYPSEPVVARYEQFFDQEIPDQI